MTSDLIRFSLEWWQIFLAGISTLAIYTFLYKENPIYRFYEHLFIGIATGYGIVYLISSFLWPRVLKPLLGYDRVFFPDGTVSEAYNTSNLLWLLPMSFGMLFYCILTKRHKWLAQLVIGCQLGFAGGLAFKGTFNELLPQIYDSFKPLYVAGSFFDSITNIVFIVTIICTLSYFFFTYQAQEGSKSRLEANIRLWLVLAVFIGFCFLSCLFRARFQEGAGVFFYVPFVLSAFCALLFLKSSREGLSDRESLLSRAVLVSFGLVIVALILSLSGEQNKLLDLPEINLSLVLTTLIFISYFITTLSKTAGGLQASSGALGRWLMMGCFGAFFGSTIMARMAILVERLEFLIKNWATIF
jgi:hypothetical protein